MKRVTSRGSRYHLSNRYNLILLVIYTCLLCTVLFKKQSDRYQRDLMLILLFLSLIMTLIRLSGFGKSLRFLDLLITVAFIMMLLGCKLRLPDITGLIITTSIGFLTMTVGGPWAYFSGLIVLFPSMVSIWEHWKFHTGYWFEILMAFCLITMLLLSFAPDNDHTELAFLPFSFLSKAAILIYVTS